MAGSGTGREGVHATLCGHLSYTQEERGWCQKRQMMHPLYGGFTSSHHPPAILSTDPALLPSVLVYP